MIKHIWSVLCSQSLIDTSSNNISLIGILEEVHLTRKPSSPSGQKERTKGKPAFPIVMEWVTLWERTQDDSTNVVPVRDIVSAPSGKILVQEEYNIDFGKHKRMRWRRKFSSLPERGPGRYQFSTQIKDEKTNTWESVSNLPLEVFVETQ